MQFLSEQEKAVDPIKMHTFSFGFHITNYLIIFFRDYGSGCSQKTAVTRIAEKLLFLQLQRWPIKQEFAICRKLA